MYSAAERDRKLAAASKRLAAAMADRERYEGKAKAATARADVEERQIEWLQKMPIADPVEPEEPAS